MDAQKIVEDDLKNTVRRALQDGILINPKIGGDFFKNKSKITSKYQIFNNEEEFINEYSHQYEAGCYLAAFEDGAFLQINYEFSNKGKRKIYLEKMNLCYLPPVIAGRVQKEYIRIDYNNSPDNSFFHSFAHVHVGFKNELRIPIDEVLLFSEFLKLILYFFYPPLFQKFCDNTVKTTNTKDNSGEGKLTRNKVLTLELRQFMHIKTIQ